MSQPEGEGAQSGTDDTQSGGVQGNSGESGANGGSTGDTGGSGTQSGGETGKTYSQQEYDALAARMKAADQRAAKFESDLKQLRDKDLPEADKLKRDHEEAVKKAEQYQRELEEMRISNAFLTDNTYKWRNPATALKLLDRGKISIDSDGQVIGMKDALTALAKSDDYLLEPKQGNDSGQQGQGGTAPGNNGGAGGGKTPAKQAVSRFPAMRSRGIGSTT